MQRVTSFFTEDNIKTAAEMTAASAYIIVAGTNLYQGDYSTVLLSTYLASLLAILNGEFTREGVNKRIHQGAHLYNQASTLWNKNAAEPEPAAPVSIAGSSSPKQRGRRTSTPKMS